MRIVAFGGLGGAGKTTAAKILAEWAFENGYTPVLEQFAKPLKESAAVLGFHKGGPSDHLYRAFCQTEGERARTEDEEWFVDALRSRLADHGREEAGRFETAAGFHEIVVIVDDLRFANEIGLMRDSRACCVFVDAYKRLSQGPDWDAEWRAHYSEDMAREYTHGTLPDSMFDHRITNNTTMQELKRMVRALAPHLLGEIAEERLHD